MPPEMTSSCEGGERWLASVTSSYYWPLRVYYLLLVLLVYTCLATLKIERPHTATTSSSGSGGSSSSSGIGSRSSTRSSSGSSNGGSSSSSIDGSSSVGSGSFSSSNNSSNHNSPTSQSCTSGEASALEVLRFADSVIRECKVGSKLPTVTVSYAQTIDGSIAPLARTRLHISSPLSFQLLHSLRAQVDAVVIGINTVFADDPQLNVRNPLPGVIKAFPRSVVIDSDLKILDYPTKLRLSRPIVCTCVEENDERWLKAQKLLNAVDGSLLRCNRDVNGWCDLTACFESLKNNLGVQSVLVEGGARIIQSVLEDNLADLMVVTIRPTFLGGYRSLTRQLQVPMNLENPAVASVGGDIVIFGRIGKKAMDLGASGQDPDARPAVRLVLPPPQQTCDPQL